MIGDRPHLAVIAVVTAVWAGNFVASLIPAMDYEPDQAINGIFMVIVGAMFAIGARNGNNGGGAPPGNPPSPGGQGPSENPPAPATAPVQPDTQAGAGPAADSARSDGAP